MRPGQWVLAGSVVVGAALALLCFTPWFVGVQRQATRYSTVTGPYPLAFPPGFAWGVAVAAQQVEHQQPTDWTGFERRAVAEGLTGTGSQPGQALPGQIHGLDRWPAEVRDRKADFDARFDQDFAALAALGLNAYRFSIDWARLFPRPGMTGPDSAGVAFYQRVIASLKAHGLTPHVTLFHFSSPEWFWQERNGKRGWERDDALEHWGRFVDAVAQAYGAEVSDWCTLNEPMVFVFNGYLEGIFPPLERRGKPEAAAPVVARLLEAHAMAYRALHADAARRGRTIRVGITQHTRAFEPWRNWWPLDRLAAGFVRQAFIWDVLDAIESGTYAMANTGYRVTIPGLAGSQDYVGINYYGRFYVEMGFGNLASGPVIHPNDPRAPGEVTSDLGWAEYPRGFTDVLVETHRRYGRPILVLENGVADSAADDRGRQAYLVRHLRELWHAVTEEGVPVAGYFHWSALDNFEWAEGFEPRFGLFAVDYLDDFRRTPRPGAALYQRIIREGISAGLWREYGGVSP
jgi:beta-glucosidase